jgi:phosphatidylglycerol:prolipoprotein diacylglycerol transferase
VVDFDDFIIWITLGIILGGRTGYVLFYNLPLFLTHPLEIFELWHGGMSFHGGVLGCIVAIVLFALHRGIPILSLGDVTTAVAPIGLFLGRIANFINGELWGRPSNVPWAMIFPSGGPIPRHPSQLYEAALEGVLLFVLLQIALRVFRAHQRPGLISALFFLGYGTFRFICEFFREPDTQFIGPVSMGMALSIPVWLTAGALFWIAYRKPNAA